jgi:hydroxymethylpyrimidine/phosphomethylpyrimidine kinase
MNVVEAAGQAKVLVLSAIEHSLQLGKGHGPVNILRKLYS